MKDILGAIIRVSLNKNYLTEEYTEIRCLEQTTYQITGGLQSTTKKFKIDSRTHIEVKNVNLSENEYLSTLEISVTPDEVRLFIQKDFSLFDSDYFKIQALNDVVGRYLKSAPTAEQ